MRHAALVWPMLAQIFLTFVVLGLMARARIAALKSREVTMGQVAVSNDAWPTKAKQAANNFTNQFETPVLFFALCLLAMTVGAGGWIMTLLAWGYVATRVAHTVVHVGSNDVRLRFNIFAVSVTILFLMALGVAFAAL